MRKATETTGNESTEPTESAEQTAPETKTEESICPCGSEEGLVCADCWQIKHPEALRRVGNDLKSATGVLLAVFRA